jgi:hypothetical protein
LVADEHNISVKVKIVPCDGYTCGFGGDGVKNPQFHLAAIPE